MRITRILDLVVILLLATVVLMPRPDVTVKPALQVDPELRDRVAELQSIIAGHPDAVDPALEAANIYLDGHRPDWALATVDSAIKSHPDDYRLHHLRAPACGPAAHARLALLRTTLENVSKVDMRNKPYLAKDRIMESLHPVFIPR